MFHRCVWNVQTFSTLAIALHGRVGSVIHLLIRMVEFHTTLICHIYRLDEYVSSKFVSGEVQYGHCHGPVTKDSLQYSKSISLNRCGLLVRSTFTDQLIKMQHEIMWHGIKHKTADLKLLSLPLLPLPLFTSTHIKLQLLKCDLSASFV